MKNYKEYAWKGLAVVAFLLLAVGVVRAAVVGLTLNIQNWSGNLMSSDSSDSSDSSVSSEPNNIGAGYDQGKLIPFKYNFDQGFAMNGVDAWTNGNINASGTLNVPGTSTLGYTLNQLNTPQTAMNGNSTTVCSVQNTSGVNRIITSLVIASTGSTGDGAVTSWRGYVSAGRADNNTANTSTLLKTIELAVGATTLQVFGGPVPGSYMVTSTGVGLNALGLATTTPVLWRNGWYANVTSTAIASSTGNCTIASFPL